MNIIKKIAVATMLPLFLLSCDNSPKEKKKTQDKQKEQLLTTNLIQENFETSISGKETGLYYIENAKMKVAFTNYGARIVGLWVPDINGKMTDVVVGMSSVKAFENATEPYFGATIGRVGNRIAKGTFSLNGKTYHIPLNNGKNSLHGGTKGFQYVVWDVEQPNNQTLIFKYHSPDGEEGFPGNLDVKVTYSILEKEKLQIVYQATTNKSTPVNLTNHAFFNLNGEGSGTILNHLVQINAEKYTPVDEGLIPFGNLASVTNTPFDFTTYHTIGERINSDNEQLKNGLGYDHNFVLNVATNEMTHAATVIGNTSGIIMDIYTQEPGLQFYSGNFMQGKNTFKSGAKDTFRTAFAMETQHFPDAINQPDFASIILEPYKIYHTTSIYQFSTKE
ncbi:aldose epimerase family protein [Neptunitalea lumnitzerae]|uniref:Aldose 1-epimerase n=1 Tax=Neptunitalea lumnitzerae TaxID=2965509 RepID=A0ABQ5MJK0_9FLAO|nr:aldose epimerase family protein [Neptunitalea sp. Y10]GLB49588.1 aldose 1-epimerase [Neptunitalea sp. Y10]